MAPHRARYLTLAGSTALSGDRGTVQPQASGCWRTVSAGQGIELTIQIRSSDRQDIVCILLGSTTLQVIEVVP